MRLGFELSPKRGVFLRCHLVKNWLEVRVERKRARKAAAGVLLESKRRIDHPGMEVKPGIAGPELQGGCDMRQCCARSAAAIERPGECVLSINVAAGLEFVGCQLY